MDGSQQTNTAWADLSRLLNEFRRHYHRARNIFAKLPNNGGVTVNLKGDSETDRIEAKADIPDEPLALQFALLMHRFLSPSSELYLHAIWQILVDSFGDQFRDEENEKISSLFSQLTHGPFNLMINGKKIHAADVYELMSKAHVFGNDEVAMRKLQRNVQNPILGALFSFQFADYNRTALGVASSIFDVISNLSRNGVLELSPMVDRPQCIYCRSKEGPFTSEEHIVPEAFGSHDAILLRGAVCDRCNNQLLANLDQFLVNFEPLAFLRVYFTPLNKAGEYTHAEFQNLSIARRGPRWIQFTSKDKTGEILDQQQLEDGRVTWSQSFRGRILDHILLGRALFKVALGHVAFEQGHEYALNQRYEAARRFIRGESLFQSTLFISSTVTPQNEFQLSHQYFSPGTFCLLSVYGLMFFLNLEEEPPPKLSGELKNNGFISFDLSRAKSQRTG